MLERRMSGEEPERQRSKSTGARKRICTDMECICIDASMYLYLLKNPTETH